MAKIYRIHPAIGIARMGNSDQGYFVGPEAPRLASFEPPGGSHRDNTNGILRQGARFRIYEFTFADDGVQAEPIAVREITEQDASMTWKVRLVNAKANRDALNVGTAPDGVTTITNRDAQLRIDTGEQSIGGAGRPLQTLRGRIFAGTPAQTDVTLGDLTTDEGGRLIVLGGHGKSECPFHPATRVGGLVNSWWYDDASDGTVGAEIVLRADGARPAVEPARVIIGPPDFAPAINNIVSMYDLIYDLSTRLPAGVRLVVPTTVSFTRDIFPVLMRAAQMYWVDRHARDGHAPGMRGAFMEPARLNLLRDNNPTPESPARRLREAVFRRLRSPAGGAGDMPDLNGGVTLTPTQYERFRLWSLGTFDADWNPAPDGFPPEVPFAAIPDAGRPAALDEAALEGAVGAAFDPGIEAGVAMSKLSTYDRPFRIAATVPAGALTQSLSIPWQADFHACDVGWWPGARPNFVTQNGTDWYPWTTTIPSEDDMVTLWQNLGFVVRVIDQGSASYLERERLQASV
jgi:hypothetical protein